MSSRTYEVVDWLADARAHLSEAKFEVEQALSLPDTSDTVHRDRLKDSLEKLNSAYDGVCAVRAALHKSIAPPRP